MPITDVAKKQIAQKVRLHMKICFYCGARNSLLRQLDVENVRIITCD